MANNKRFKLKFTIPSLQMCRSKHDLSIFPTNPAPAIYRLSPVNRKSNQLGHHHHHSNHPPPPPASPELRRNALKSNSSRSHHNVIARGRKSTSSVPSRRSNFMIDSINEDESESLISCLTSFSDEFGHDNYKTESNSRDLNHSWKISSSVKKVESVRFNRVRGLPETMKRSSSSSMTTVKESFAVVKKSKEPYEDFKKSMLEMISEMEISEAEDLEQLLQSFLALNSRRYHEVIVRAFMEIWQQMFIWNPAASIRNLKNGGGVEE